MDTSGSLPGSLPGSHFRVLMVCVANICRSPGAERLLALELADRQIPDTLPIKIGSAGMRGWEAAPMDERAAAALARQDGTAAGFLSRPITEALVAEASLILTATRELRSDLVATYPLALRRTFTMTEFAELVAAIPQPPASATALVAEAYRLRGGAELNAPDILDPYAKSARAHNATMAQIHDAMTPIAEALNHCRKV